MLHATVRSFDGRLATWGPLDPWPLTVCPSHGLCSGSGPDPGLLMPTCNIFFGQRISCTPCCHLKCLCVWSAVPPHTHTHTYRNTQTHTDIRKYIMRHLIKTMCSTCRLKWKSIFTVCFCSLFLELCKRLCVCVYSGWLRVCVCGWVI